MFRNNNLQGPTIIFNDLKDMQRRIIRIDFPDWKAP